jgi:hypothetical protein
VLFVLAWLALPAEVRACAVCFSSRDESQLAYRVTTVLL